MPTGYDQEKTFLIELKESVNALSTKFDVFSTVIQSKIDSLIEKQNEMAEAQAKVDNELYTPTTGVFARLQELESWKNTTSKVVWTIASVVLGLVATKIYSLLTILPAVLPALGGN